MIVSYSISRPWYACNLWYWLHVKVVWFLIYINLKYELKMIIEFHFFLRYGTLLHFFFHHINQMWYASFYELIICIVPLQNVTFSSPYFKQTWGRAQTEHLNNSWQKSSSRLTKCNQQIIAVRDWKIKFFPIDTWQAMPTSPFPVFNDALTRPLMRKCEMNIYIK